ncbi:MAG: hypothetical protein ACO3NJ_06315, partial [Candidatus Poseidoniaceae archaeon]
KSGTDVTGAEEAYRPRSKSDFKENGFEIWGLYSNPKKTIQLNISGLIIEGKIEESGFVF